MVLVLDTEPYRYQKYISDLAGRDPVAHHNSEEEVIDHVRNWLRLGLDPKLKQTASGSLIYQRYQQFQADLPSLAENSLNLFSGEHFSRRTVGDHAAII